MLRAHIVPSCLSSQFRRSYFLIPFHLTLLRIFIGDIVIRRLLQRQNRLRFGMRATLRSRGNPGRVSIALVLSYVVDWIVIIVAAGVGAIFSTVTPNKRPFSLVDADISFPYVHKEKISTATLIICGLVAPAVIIFLITFIFVPGPTVPKSTPKPLIWRRKLWEWHAGWLGLGLALASAFLITDGMKNLFGKPRPDLLSRCNPDLNNIANYAVGGFAQTKEGFLLVTAAICQNKDKSIMDDGFRSFPSGHSSFSAAGLIYLSLFLASKFSITFPFLAPSPWNAGTSRFSAFPSRAEKPQRRPGQKISSDKSEPSSEVDHYLQRSDYNNIIVAVRNQAAAPPVYLLVIVVIPFFASIYIASTRWSDFRHHGFDILFGYFIGAVSAIFAFRYYHLPLSQGAGWSWGPRSRDRSFWAGVGVGNYVGSSEKDVGRDPGRLADLEVEAGHRQGNHEVSAESTSTSV